MVKQNLGKVFQVVAFVMQTAFFCSAAIISVFQISCRITEAGIQIIGGDYAPPVLEELKVISENQVELYFGEEITLVNAVVSPFINNVSDSELHSETDIVSQAIFSAGGGFGKIETEAVVGEDGKSIVFDFLQPTAVGKSYELYGTVKDKIGNTLTFCIPFVGYNSKVPDVIMTKIHPQMVSQSAAEKNAGTRRVEFVEFLALSDGNLIGLELCSAAYGEEKKYVFPAVEVHKGEVFVVHLRTWGEGCVSEEGKSIEEAYSGYCKDNLRDLWNGASVKCVGDKTDVVILKNKVTGRVVDAVMYRDDSVDDWSDKLKEPYFANMDVVNIYGATDINSATNVSKLTPSQVIYRLNAQELYEAVMDGDKVDYPVKSDGKSWCVGTKEVGVL